jgi:hypothetical protein
MLPARHVVFSVHDRADAFARARAVAPHLRGRVTIVAQAATPGLDHRVPGLVVTGRDPAGSGPIAAAAAATAGTAAAATPSLVDDHLDTLAALLPGLAPDLLVVDGAADAYHLAARTDVPVVGVRGATWTGPAEPVAPWPAAWLAPFPAVLDRSGAPSEVQEQTLYAGLLSPSSGSRLTRAAARRRLGLEVRGRHLTIALDREAEPLDVERLVAAVARAPRWSASVVGRVADGAGDGVADGAGAGDGATSSAQLHVEPDVSRLLPHLVAADAVLSDGSLGILAEVAAVRRPLAVLAGVAARGGDPLVAEALEAMGAAILLPTWPPEMAWPALLAELLDHPTRPLAHFDDGRGPRRAAGWLDGWAAEAPVAAAAS